MSLISRMFKIIKRHIRSHYIQIACMTVCRYHPDSKKEIYAKGCYEKNKYFYEDEKIFISLVYGRFVVCIKQIDLLGECVFENVFDMVGCLTHNYVSGAWEKYVISLSSIAKEEKRKIKAKRKTFPECSKDLNAIFE